MTLIFNHQTESIQAGSGILSLSLNTGALILPQSGSAARPGTPLAAMLRYNTDSNTLEFYNGAAWVSTSGSNTITSSGSSTNLSIATFNGTTGISIQSSPGILDNSGNLSGLTSVTTTTINATTGSNLSINAAGTKSIILTPGTAGNLQLINNYWPSADGSANFGVVTNGTNQLSFQKVLLGTNNLSDVSNSATALTNLGGRKYTSTISMSSSGTLSSSAFGSIILINNPNITVTLPALSTTVDGLICKFVSNYPSGAGSYTIQTSGTDKMYWYPNYLNVGSVNVNGVDSPEIESFGGSAGVWFTSSYQNSGIPAAPQSSFKNLKIVNYFAGNYNAVMAVTADAVVLQNSLGNSFVATSVSVNPYTGSNGVNGLDIGSVSSNTWYYIYVIYNGTTVAGLYSTSSTNPTMPSGYTFKARVGACRTNSSNNLYQIIQYGKRAQYIVGTNPTTMPQMASGASGNFNTPVWTALAWSSFAPATAASIIIVGTGGSSGGQIIAPNSSYGAIASTSNPPLLQGPSVTASFGVIGEIVLESANIYYAQQTNAQIYCSGWTDNL